MKIDERIEKPKVVFPQARATGCKWLYLLKKELTYVVSFIFGLSPLIPVKSGSVYIHFPNLTPGRTTMNWLFTGQMHVWFEMKLSKDGYKITVHFPSTRGVREWHPIIVYKGSKPTSSTLLLLLRITMSLRGGHSLCSKFRSTVV